MIDFCTPSVFILNKITQDMEKIYPELKDAARMIVRSGNAGVSQLMTAFGTTYLKASRMLSQMEELGILGQQDETGRREILVSEEELERILTSL